MRTTKTGGTRSDKDGKIAFLGFRHPVCERSFGHYMMTHQTQEDGQQRTADNWWKGLDPQESIQSLNRHVEHLNALFAGYYVIVYHIGKIQYDIYSLPKDLKESLKKVEKFKWHLVTKESASNAIRFNTQTIILESLK